MYEWCKSWPNTPSLDAKKKTCMSLWRYKQNKDFPATLRKVCISTYLPASRHKFPGQAKMSVYKYLFWYLKIFATLIFHINQSVKITIFSNNNSCAYWSMKHGHAQTLAMSILNTCRIQTRSQHISLICPWIIGNINSCNLVDTIRTLHKHNFWNHGTRVNK